MPTKAELENERDRWRQLFENERLRANDASRAWQWQIYFLSALCLVVGGLLARLTWTCQGAVPSSWTQQQQQQQDSGVTAPGAPVLEVGGPMIVEIRRKAREDAIVRICVIHRDLLAAQPLSISQTLYGILGMKEPPADDSDLSLPAGHPDQLDTDKLLSVLADHPVVRDFLHMHDRSAGLVDGGAMPGSHSHLDNRQNDDDDDDDDDDDEDKGEEEKQEEEDKDNNNHDNLLSWLRSNHGIDPQREFALLARAAAVLDDRALRAVHRDVFVAAWRESRRRHRRGRAGEDLDWLVAVCGAQGARVHGWV